MPRHPAVEKRWQQMLKEGMDPGEDYDYETKTTKILEHPTSFGSFKVYLQLYPQIDSAWFEADAQSAYRFRSPPARSGGVTAESGSPVGSL